MLSIKSCSPVQPVFRFSSLSVALLACSAIPAQAFQFDTGNQDLSVRWDNTVKYSNAWRVKKAADKLTSDPNLDDGDRNFSRGLVSNRLDLFSELDASYKAVGARVSGAAWYDDVYNRRNDNNSPATVNSASVPYDKFTDDTRDLQGRQAEFRDAFVYGNFDLGDSVSGVARLGQHALVYGESLFYGNNAIAAGQQPIDAVRALQVPNSQYKELGLPVKQFSTQLQLTPAVTVGGYYQFDWKPNRIPAAGSYFSPADMADEGGERIIAAPGAYLYRGRDIDARDSGQFGIQLRYRSEALDTDFGLYAINYHAKDFQLEARPGLNAGLVAGGALKVGEYDLVYPEDIKAYGFSASRAIGDASVAFEASIRTNAPLVSDAVLMDLSGTGDNDHNRLYAVGRTAHMNLNTIYVTPPTALWNSATVLAELAWNRTLSVKTNPDVVDANSTRDATAIRVAFTPEYYQVFEGVDLSVPMGFSYGVDGRSSAVANFSQAKGGDYNIGLKAEYLKQVTFTLAYNGFFGPSAPETDVNNGNVRTYKQTYADRDFISFSVSHTF